ncbi:hypothetical protein, partial [Pseudomonas sp. URMO17WK12:I11]|uniref:hypothetical protein n=1 Tax=Pseudomonas sp. URMO17WK12:I11 TaxID=1283291 RepID=UPI001C497FCB
MIKRRHRKWTMLSFNTHTNAIKVQSSKLKAQSSKLEIRSSKFKAWAHTASWYSLARVAHSHPSALTA